MNSFIPWIGGKKLLRKEIIGRFPRDKIDRYIEVFGGAGWVLFYKENKTGQLEVFNDIDENLINLYRCIKYHAEAVQKELDWLLVSRETFYNYKRLINIGGCTDIQRASMYLYLVKVSFGADRKSFATSSKNIDNTKKLLIEVQKRLSSVVIENKSYESIIKVYDRENALFYLDPPYYKAESCYDSKFTEEDHINLRALLGNLKGKFILSYNNDPYIKELYKGFCIEEVIRNNNLSNKNKEYKELIIRNY
ncbi:modification methylase DpnIIA [Thomasclavelia cocleata]|uniref:site-specific DNA-methyltransferase (adenine-specific) n=1 Tax=Thomasclavelia cocleata TaxID=69824 RepID=A0A829ZB17_9FIRM|nr:DNA adenine methylase [Thomasclavelia cocleata]GFI41162.1 modification methylase DpnIIA [Thomasclavelia cocleata]